MSNEVSIRNGHQAMKSRRLAAIAALVLLALAVTAMVLNSIRVFPRGLLTAVLVALSFGTLWEAFRRPGRVRPALMVLAGLLLIAAVAALLTGRILAEAFVAIGLFLLSTVAARRAFRTRIALPPAERPRRPVMIWNPRSGRGQAAAANLDAEARARGIEPIELRPGDDLHVLVRDAVARGADALAAAGGDGTQAIVATIAAEHDLPFACVPAGTRNHFALDLGVDRDDVVGALDAFVDGGERLVDLAEVNGRVFVNNVSLGLYAHAVQRDGYRDAKLRTMLDTLPAFVGTAPSGEHELRYAGPSDIAGKKAIVVMVSNNSYRLGRLIGSGTRPRIDDGLLGVAVLVEANNAHRPTWKQWMAPSFTVESNSPVPAGVDGEALVFDPPLHFTMRPGALRVRIAPQHPGASPSAAQPTGLIDAIKKLVHIVWAG
jgi:diacylglycerol kinase family enzyme